MGWEDVWKIVLCAVASAGGIGGVIVAAVKFSANSIANRLAQKYELKLHKELERYKSGLDNKIYISKTKFDTEFALYRELSKSFFKMVKAITIMIPVGLAHYPVDKEERKKYEDELYETALKTTVEAQDVLNSNIPFIPNDLYTDFEEILGLCRMQIGVFEQRWNAFYFVPQKEKEAFSTEDFLRSKEIRDQFSTLTAKLREYLSKLDVLE